MSPLRLIAAFMLACFATLSTAAPDTFPPAGTAIELEGSHWIVAGSGMTVMEYTATGESLAIYIHEPHGWVAVMTFVPNAGQTVRLDPAAPMLWVDGTQQKTFAGNGYLLKTGKGKGFMLLEYDRAAN